MLLTVVGRPRFGTSLPCNTVHILFCQTFPIARFFEGLLFIAYLGISELHLGADAKGR